MFIPLIVYEVQDLTEMETIALNSTRFQIIRSNF